MTAKIFTPGEVEDFFLGSGADYTRPQVEGILADADDGIVPDMRGILFAVPCTGGYRISVRRVHDGKIASVTTATRHVQAPVWG